ncbi:MAG: hypothetical protein ACI9DJ_001816, partial [Algoriphagus sp.]
MEDFLLLFFYEKKPKPTSTFSSPCWYCLLSHLFEGGELWV